ncbi:Electron transport complex protein rnfB [Planctomycetes bacterium CA13]|uniref:Ion-translocating oxidoreductase complex subunit B n=1 Tax=Novipirellula herctigrandis TaxID=2527986 RepID=A0A5C5YVJ2_9BACT|nr:Electron transport complex protein rnfB [Planctomycetes bacterium CA13]
MLILNAVATIGGLTFVLASLLVVANRYLHVIEDPRIGTVEDMLPHTNCGACGYPGCRAFAEALVSGETSPAKCSVGGPSDHERVATYLGVDVGAQEKRVARLSCAGGSNVARDRAVYQGHQSCAAAALVAGGGKACFWGCLGVGDCEVACDFDAITMNANELPVVNEDLCTACGDCVEACPKDLFSIHPAKDRLWVACSSLEQGDEVLAECEVACTGCTRCAMDAPDQIQMRNSLPVIDYTKGPLTAEPTQRCPTGAIVWLDKDVGPVKGQAAKKVIRQGGIHNAIT